jgi:hypothetical protein
MPKKGKKGTKKKEPAFLTDPASCEPFGFMVSAMIAFFQNLNRHVVYCRKSDGSMRPVQANDIIVTPMGLEITIIGVKKTDPK